MTSAANNAADVFVCGTSVIQSVCGPMAKHRVSVAGGTGFGFDGTGDGTPLFAVYKRRHGLVAPSGTLQ